MINYVIAGLILAVWMFVVMSFLWDPSKSLAVNLFAWFSTILIFAAIHWIPFWLIFLK